MTRTWKLPAWLEPAGHRRDLPGYVKEEQTRLTARRLAHTPCRGAHRAAARRAARLAAVQSLVWC